MAPANIHLYFCLDPGLGRYRVSYLIEWSIGVNTGTCETDDRDRVADLADADKGISVPRAAVNVALGAADAVAPGRGGDLRGIESPGQWTAAEWSNIPHRGTWIGAAVRAGCRGK